MTSENVQSTRCKDKSYMKREARVIKSLITFDTRCAIFLRDNNRREKKFLVSLSRSFQHSGENCCTGDFKATSQLSRKLQLSESNQVEAVKQSRVELVRFCPQHLSSVLNRPGSCQLWRNSTFRSGLSAEELKMLQKRISSRKVDTLRSLDISR